MSSPIGQTLCSYLELKSVVRIHRFRRMLCIAFLVSVSCLSSFAMKESANALQISNPATQSPAIAQDSSQKMSPQELRIQQSKKQLTEDTAKLLQLANELKVEMDKSTKDTLSLSVVKKAEQVEKMAHRVRDEMKLTLGN